jgi:hypothetical protein
MNYLTAVGYPNEQLASWPPSLQVLGKDIFRYELSYLFLTKIQLNLKISRHLLALLSSGSRIAIAPAVVCSRPLAYGQEKGMREF